MQIFTSCDGSHRSDRVATSNVRPTAATLARWSLACTVHHRDESILDDPIASADQMAVQCTANRSAPNVRVMAGCTYKSPSSLIHARLTFESACAQSRPKLRIRRWETGLLAWADPQTQPLPYCCQSKSKLWLFLTDDHCSSCCAYFEAPSPLTVPSPTARPPSSQNDHWASLFGGPTRPYCRAEYYTPSIDCTCRPNSHTNVTSRNFAAFVVLRVINPGLHSTSGNVRFIPWLSVT